MLTDIVKVTVDYPDAFSGINTGGESNQCVLRQPVFTVVYAVRQIEIVLNTVFIALC